MAERNPPVRKYPKSDRFLKRIAETLEEADKELSDDDFEELLMDAGVELNKWLKRWK
jgi:hypothetical protein